MMDALLFVMSEKISFACVSDRGNDDNEFLHQQKK